MWLHMANASRMAMKPDNHERRGTPARVLAPPGLPSPAAVHEHEAIEALAERQLADARKAAENWRTGLAGLLTLLTTILVVRGKDSISDIAVGWRWPLGFCLVGAVVIAVAGAYWSLAAAYGRPRVIRTADIEREGGV